MIAIGKLNRRIQIEAKSATTDDYGQPIEDWSAVGGKVWANIRPMSVSEQVQGMQMTSRVSHTIAIRYKAELVPSQVAGKYRVKYLNRIFNVRGAIDFEEGHRYMVMMCEEGSVDGQ